MIIITGLGNPEEKYLRTRHNAGFTAVDEFQKKNNFSDFIFSKKINSLISEGVFNNEKIIIIKPQTHMNNSGRAVRLALDYYKGKCLDLFVIHDDSDLVLGKIKIVKNRGSAGHKGVESIINEIGSQDFIRIRIGIRSKNLKDASDFVLKKFSQKEEVLFKRAVKKTIEAVEYFKKEGLKKTMNKYN
ncbi:MAG: aminoacyl-tRNA hydrolase [Candidatus Pacebacteria bacterium]|nr:aminoacyl-tRNA hydrolase [Candidatus Paceibacterota bacterium]